MMKTLYLDLEALLRACAYGHFGPFVEEKHKEWATKRDEFFIMKACRRETELAVQEAWYKSNKGELMVQNPAE